MYRSNGLGLAGEVTLWPGWLAGVVWVWMCGGYEGRVDSAHELWVWGAEVYGRSPRRERLAGTRGVLCCWMRVAGGGEEDARGSTWTKTRTKPVVSVAYTALLVVADTCTSASTVDGD